MIQSSNRIALTEKGTATDCILSPLVREGAVRRVRVKRWDSDGTIIVEEVRSSSERAVVPASAYMFERLVGIMKQGSVLNLLDCACGPDGTLRPREIIFEPDYLIEITSLCACIQEHGASPMTYILNLFKDNNPTNHTLLGEAANLFLDDCVNESAGTPATYSASMSKFFREYPLQLTAADNIGAEFFESTKSHFSNIRQTVGRLLSPLNNDAPENIYIEPSFFCEALGLQGRIDLLDAAADNIIELKSGKADEYCKDAKEEHVLQMSLYKEMLIYNLAIPRERVNAHLFYSRYPGIMHRESSREQISEALMLRNEIVALMHRLADGTLRPALENMSADDLNVAHTVSRLWSAYKRPEIVRLLSTIQKASPLEKEYFFGNISFVAREMRIGKTGGGADSTKGGFADTWNLSREEKQANGNILAGLKIKELVNDEGVSAIIFERPACSDDFFPNFRAGDTAFIYTADTDDACATNRHVTRGTLTGITADEICFKLRHKQRNPHIFPAGALYALEHDHLDSTSRTSFREMHSLLVAPQERRRLILCERRPTFDSSRTLAGDYGNEHINNIVLKAKQANELFLLVGPPGTGKTSKALSSMVQEFYADGGCNVLLASFTNRAVDEICQALEALPQKPDYIRIGNEYACAAEYTHRLLKNVISGCTRREHISDVLQSTRIIVGTISSISGRQELFRMKRFDVAIIDEATQILESHLAGVLAATAPDGSSAIEKFILIGDPKQLPAVVAQSPAESEINSPLLREHGFTSHTVSFFERIYNYYAHRSLPELTASLYAQGRMHPQVGEFANRHFYGGSLAPIPLPHQSEQLCYDAYDASDAMEANLATRRTMFVPTKASGEDENPKINRDEAMCMAAHIAAYCRLRQKNGYACNPSKEIGVIVPFRSQIAMVTNEIARLKIVGTENIVIDTVERFQGSQRDVIFYGTTISSPSMMEILSVTSEDADGLLVDRKLNVAVTRARRQMFVFGVPDALDASPLYAAMMQELNV